MSVWPVRLKAADYPPTIICLHKNGYKPFLPTEGQTKKHQLMWFRWNMLLYNYLDSKGKTCVSVSVCLVSGECLYIQTGVYRSPWQLGLNMTGLDCCCLPSVRRMHFTESHFKRTEPDFPINFLSTLNQTQFRTHDEIIIGRGRTGLKFGGISAVQLQSIFNRYWNQRRPSVLLKKSI